MTKEKVDFPPALTKQWDPFFFKQVGQNPRASFQDTRNTFPEVCPSDHPFIGQPLFRDLVCSSTPWTEDDLHCLTASEERVEQVKREYPSLKPGVCPTDTIPYAKDRNKICCYPVEPWMSQEVLDLNKGLWHQLRLSDDQIPDPSKLLDPSILDTLVFELPQRSDPLFAEKLREEYQKAMNGQLGEFGELKDILDQDIQLEEELSSDQDRREQRQQDQTELETETLEKFILDHLFWRYGTFAVEKHIPQIRAIYENEKFRDKTLPPFDTFLSHIMDQLKAKRKHLWETLVGEANPLLLP